VYFNARMVLKILMAITRICGKNGFFHPIKNKLKGVKDEKM